MGNTVASPLLELKNIGKIYVSEGTVAVGIRGVSLAFDKGEFVAVTGKSGSGKSTLLNVISGMDTYEEGEFFVEGEPTSHYLQKDWEEYRKQYISFIFQEYNIIESFTVLQNVELALMNISDPRERRKKALELLDRVGLTKFIHHQGSKLSGGQKQRTVIARALAKDSPIILADEPTGNLDSQTSAEIIELLREVSRDKLVIVVTHNFEQVEACATRHIRIFDGAVESDTVISRPENGSGTEPGAETVSAEEPTAEKTRREIRRENLRNGLTLGGVRFRARPKLSVFLCVLLTVSALALALITSFMADASGLFDKPEMFTHMKGRVVVARTDGGVIGSEEAEKLKNQFGASDALAFDYMLDKSVYTSIRTGDYWDYYEFRFSYPAEGVSLDGGRLPARPDEVLLSVPVFMKPTFGEGDSFAPTLLKDIFEMANYTAVGVHYYYDNTKVPLMYFTEEGYRVATAIAFFRDHRFSFNVMQNLYYTNGENKEPIYDYNGGGDVLRVDFGMAPGTYALTWTGTETFAKENYDPAKVTAEVTLTGSFRDTYYYYDYDYDYKKYGDVFAGSSKYGQTGEVAFGLGSYTFTTEFSPEAALRTQDDPWSLYLYVAPDVMTDFLVDAYFGKSYTQASLFFPSDAQARGKIEELREAGYVGVVSDEKVDEDVLDKLERVLTFGAKAIGWLLSVLFLTLFLNLCTAKSLNATKGDVAIMRSMGIPTPVIRLSAYAQMFLCLVPAMIVTAVTCAVIFTVPKTNGIFTFLHARDYVILGILLILLTARLSRKYVRRMFNESVKKTLKGGNKE